MTATLTGGYTIVLAVTSRDMAFLTGYSLPDGFVMVDDLAWHAIISSYPNLANCRAATWRFSPLLQITDNCLSVVGICINAQENLLPNISLTRRDKIVARFLVRSKRKLAVQSEDFCCCLLE